MPGSALLSVRELGRSVEGRPVHVWIFGGPAPTPPWDALFLGAIHGDEKPSADLLEDWRDWLTADAARLASLTSRGPIGVVAVANPDGLAAAMRVNARGVDLNRNYPARQWTRSGEGTPYDAGPEPASEPETRLLMTLIEEVRPRKIISIHTPYRVVNYDGPAEALARAMSAENGYPVVADIGYPTPGSFGTYWGVERQTPVITLELPEDDSRADVARDNIPALAAACRFDVPQANRKA